MDWKGWAPAFVFTLIVETPVYVLTLRRSFGTRGALLASLALNLATHPLAWSTITRARGPSLTVFMAVDVARR